MNFKRIFDIVFSFLGLIFLLPFFIFISLVIKLDSKGPIFYEQLRVGRRGVKFKILKFRTMILNADKIGKLITTSDDKRITRSGKWIRKYKLDEFPQLINVFKGEMSFVGPRPEVPKYVEFYPPEIKDVVLSVRPGIADEASIKYRNENEILSNYKGDPEICYLEKILPMKLSLYKYYVQNNSLLGDIKIIMKTIFVIIKR